MFVPYIKGRPAALAINGHRVIIVSPDRESLEDGLALVGGDKVRKLRSGETEESQNVAMNRLARTIKGGVVVAPSDLEVEDVIRNLESELPWIH